MFRKKTVPNNLLFKKKKKKKKKVNIDKKIVEFSMAGMLKTHERVRSKREKERGKREGLGSIYYKERERERLKNEKHEKGKKRESVF